MINLRGGFKRITISLCLIWTLFWFGFFIYCSITSLMNLSFLPDKSLFVDVILDILEDLAPPFVIFILIGNGIIIGIYFLINWIIAGFKEKND